MTTPFLITGCGRSGTAWAAALFTELGYPCGHEQVFSYDREGPLTGGESSWLAVPHLDSLDPSTRLLRILRNPFDVARSAMAKGFLADMDDPYAQYVALHRPDIASPEDHMGRVIRWVSLWDEPVAGWEYWPLHVIASARTLTEVVYFATGGDATLANVREAMDAVGTTINASPGERPDVEAFTSHPDGELLVTRAIRMGYWTEVS